jgi:23S rRNA (uracil1939-C5)-methyltransferase
MSTLTLEATIAELSSGGEGVAICEIAGERRAVFVGGVIPGERAVVEVDTSRRPARGRMLRLVEASPSRVTPPCAHVERCGGCDWMHLAPSEQAAEHARIVARLLGVAEGRVAVHRAPAELAYRTRARVHVAAKRGRIVAGMFARRSHEPAAVDRCVILDPVLDRARDALPAWLEGARGHGEAHLSMSRSRTAVLDLRWNGDLPAALFARLERATTDAEARIAGARIFAGDVRVPAKIGDPTPYIAGADGAPLKLAPGGFSQATESGNVTLASHVAELVKSLPPGPCLELYSGAGNLTVLLARERDVVAVERDAAACAAARENLSARSLTAKVVEADAASYAVPKGTSVVVLDPPREGARTVAEALAERVRRKAARAPAIVYVACDPPTLGRDVQGLLDAGYELRSVDTFEMFPQTSHVESVVVLTPREP